MMTLIKINPFRFVLLCLLLLMTASCLETNRSGQPGTMADDFRLETLSHERFYLNQHRGRVVLLVFWTTWCSQCKKELAGLKSLLKDVSNESLSVAALCSDPENMNALKSIVSGWDISYPVLLDQDAGIFKKYGLRGFPSTVLIDKEGRIAMVRNGYSALIMKQIEGKVKDLLSRQI